MSDEVENETLIHSLMAMREDMGPEAWADAVENAGYDSDAILAHYGVPGMQWGKRNPKTGVRPIARALNNGPMGKASRASVDAHNRGSRVSKAASASVINPALSKKNKESRSDYKKRVSALETEFNQKKIGEIFDKAIKSGDDVLIATRYAGDTVKTIETGKSFVEKLSSGRAFDARATEIFANKTAEGPYQLTGNNTQFIKPKRGS